MSADPLFAPGAAGLVNDAWGTFPSWDGCVCSNGLQPVNLFRCQFGGLGHDIRGDTQTFEVSDILDAFLTQHFSMLSVPMVSFLGGSSKL